MKVVVLTCDKYLWCLRPFAYLFNVYWSALQEVIVVGYARPAFVLPDNFSFFSVAPASYPPERWSDGLLVFLQQFPEPCFTLMLEDYWLIRGVDHGAVASLDGYLEAHQNVLRVDLTGDRLYSTRATDLECWGHLDLIETPADAPYQLSLQAGVWNRRRLLQILQPGQSPWGFEIQDHRELLLSRGLRVLGTRQMPVRYVNGVGSGHGAKYTEGIPAEHLQRLESLGWL